MTPTLARTAAVILAAIASAGGGETSAAVERDLGRAERQWDAGAAVTVLTRARSLRRATPSPAATLLQARAALLAAELLRVRYEETPTDLERETLGKRIDAFASEALDILPSLPESSERWRLEADLVATMMRSDFRARKYEGRFRAAVARALRLDPANPRALVSQAKPLLFAPPEHGRDDRAGIVLLDKALSLSPRLESALLLRALAHEALGERADAEADWRTALAQNPQCAPAQRALSGPAAPTAPSSHPL